MDRQRCELTSSVKTSRRGDATSSAVGVGTRHITPVGQATQRLGSKIAGLRQVEEGCVSPTADGRRRESSPTTSCYNLRNTRARACRRVIAVGPGVRFATSPTRATATKTRNGQDTLHGDENRTRKCNDGAPTRRRSIRRPRQEVDSDRLLSARQTERFGTWNVRSLKGLGKLEQLGRWRGTRCQC